MVVGVLVDKREKFDVAAAGSGVGDDDEADPAVTVYDIDEGEEGDEVDTSIQNSWSVDSTFSCYN